MDACEEGQERGREGADYEGVGVGGCGGGQGGDVLEEGEEMGAGL